MKSNYLTTIATYAVLLLAGIITISLPDSLPIAHADPLASPPTIRLFGVVRDFDASHPDFDVTPDQGFGHYAGNVRPVIGSNGRPAFAGSDGVLQSGDDYFDLIAHWRFDEGSGSVVNEVLGLNNGNLLKGTNWDTGRHGTGLRFDGTNDYVEIPSSPEMQVNGDITFAGWFKLDNDFDATTPNTLVIMEKFLDTEHDFHIGLAGVDYNRPEVPKGTLVFKVENGPTSDYYYYKWTTQTSWTAGVWYHFACSLNSSNTADNAIFINGLKDTALADAGGVGFVDTSYDAPLRIGGKTIDYDGYATDIVFDGVVDDVMIFTRILTEEDFADAQIGYKVQAQWHDSASNPIAPHLYMTGGGAASPTSIPVEQTGQEPSMGILDSWDSTVGSYGGSNVGPKPDYLVVPAVADPTVPASLSALTNQGDVEFKNDTTFSSDQHFDELTIKRTLTISGHRSILCEGGIHMSTNAEIAIANNSSLSLYLLAGGSSWNHVNVNTNTGNPDLVTIYNLSSDEFLIHNHAEVYAQIVAPDAPLHLTNHGALFGRYTGKTMLFSNHGDFHLDTGVVPPPTVCGVAINDSPGTPGPDSTGGITSAQSFSQWFNDVLGVNLSIGYPIVLTWNESDSAYEFDTDAFYPINGRLLGNSANTDNHFFTYEISAYFTYDACTDQFFEFEGTDDAWLFVNGRLALDLGGILPDTSQFVEFDRLDLVDGETYPIQFFYAQRQATQANFRMRTNIFPVQMQTTSVTAGFD